MMPGFKMQGRAFEHGIWGAGGGRVCLAEGTAEQEPGGVPEGHLGGGAGTVHSCLQERPLVSAYLLRPDDVISTLGLPASLENTFIIYGRARGPPANGCLKSKE